MLPTDKLPQNSRPLYRICTKKSRLAFGKYADLTVGDALKIDEDYIVWLYFCKPDFSLHRDILDELGIIPIEKPGTDEAALKEYRWKKSQQFTEEQRMHGYFKKRNLLKRRAIGRLMAAKDAARMTKGQLQSLNHGHGKKHTY